MLTRYDVLSRAADDCMKELYSLAYPSVEWNYFLEENQIYSKKYEEWEKYRKAKEENKELYEEYNNKLDWKDKSITECIGPRPFEFYYLPSDILKDVVNDYVLAYRMDSKQELLDTIQILKNYCKEPIIDKWIEGENGDPGHRGYDHPHNLKKQIFDLVPDTGFDKSELAEKLQDKFFEFLDMAGNFYNWNRDLNAFYTTVYLGASPNSNKEAVIENWKKYRNQDIEINEEQIKKNYYGEELD